LQQGSKKDKDDKQLLALLSAVYNHSATAIVVNKEALSEEKTKKALTELLEDFADRFPKTLKQI
jgi:hypothetical protein